MKRVVIVGGGHAGAQTAIGLRHAHFDGTVTLVTDDLELPYERPPLSKDYLAGSKPFERLLLRPPAFWAERDIEIRNGQRVRAIDATAHCIEMAEGARLEYDALVWAAGGRPRSLTCAGAELIGVHSVRSRADIDRMRAELPSTTRVVVIGGGYIGLEAASVLRKLDKSVVLLEMQARILARVAGKEVSEFFTTEHRNHGVEMRTDTAVECIVGDAGRVCGVRLADGEMLSADMVIVGIGIIPNVEPLIAAGAVATNGVHVDEFCRTTLPDVFAIGDCAAHHNRFAHGERVRLESVQNANDQAATAVKAIAGEAVPYNAVPWFWSDQYDIKLQTAGLSLGYDSTIVRGDPQLRSFAVAYLRCEQLIALDCVNATRDYVQGRKLIGDGTAIDIARLHDPAVPLKDLAR